MTGHTHDLAAFTALHITFLALPPTPMTLATAVTAFGANFVGGLFPDIDQPTSDFWDNFRGGELVSRYICKLLGGHRHISHSVVGVILIGLILNWLLSALSHIILIDMVIVWWAFMIGVVSHLFFDMFTKEGIPLLWPIRIRVGIPPFKFLRFRSGMFVESLVVFPGLLILNGYLFTIHHDKILIFIRQYIQ